MIKNLAKIKDPFTAFYESIIREIGLKSIAEKKCPFKISNQRISDQGKHPVSTGIFASNSNINRAALEQLKLFDKNGKGGLYLEEVKDIVERNYLAEKEKNLFADKKDKLSSFDLSWNKYNNKVWEWIPLFILSVLSQENKTNEKKFVKFSEIEEFFYEPENTWAKFEAMYNKTKPCVTAACYGGE